MNMVCIDSYTMDGAGGSALGASVKNAHPRVPVVLIQAGSKAPPHSDERVGE